MIFQAKIEIYKPKLPVQIVQQLQCTDAKLLYGLLLDRMGLSAKNGWYDELGRVYIYYTLDEIQEDMNCGHLGCDFPAVLTAVFPHSWPLLFRSLNC